MGGTRRTVNAQDAPEAIGPYSHAVASGDLLFCSVRSRSTRSRASWSARRRPSRRRSARETSQRSARLPARASTGPCGSPSTRRSSRSSPRSTRRTERSSRPTRLREPPSEWRACRRARWSRSTRSSPPAPVEFPRLTTSGLGGPANAIAFPSDLAHCRNGLVVVAATHPIPTRPSGSPDAEFPVGPALAEPRNLPSIDPPRRRSIGYVPGGSCRSLRGRPA